MSRLVSTSSTLRMKGDNTGVPEIENKSVAINIYSQPEAKQNDAAAACNEPEVKILFIDISLYSRTIQFILCTAAAFFFYLIYGYIQELIFRLEGFRPFGWYLTLVQFACYTMFGRIELQFSSKMERRISLSTYGLLAFLTVATMGLSNTSVGYLNYPTQVIFKCCKLIPVLIGGILIQGKKYSILDVSAVLCMVIGLILFTLADSSVSPNFNTYGIILICLALCADGAIGNVQEKALKQSGASNTEMIFYSYGIGFIYIFIGLLVSNSLVPAFTFCQEYPLQTYGYAVIFSLTGYFGVVVVLTLVKTFGALVAVTVTTCRKGVTIILSFFLFSKPFTMQYVWAGLIVILGIYLNVYSKNRSSFDVKMQQYFSKLVSLSGLSHKKYVGHETMV